MAQPLSEKSKAIVTATVPALEAHGGAIVAEMYTRLLADEDIKALFNQSHQQGDSSQHAALANAILGYARNIDNLGALRSVVERIVNKHVSLQIKPEHYTHVATALLGAIEAVLGQAASREVLDAWGEAYWFLANLLIEAERKMYDDIANAEGGWKGWRDFVIVGIIGESASVKSFVLRPVDGGPVLRHQPGQYLAFDFDHPDTGKARRNYSISCAPNGEYYRISVKREPGGVISGWLHEVAAEGTVLRVAAPAGDFVLKDRPEGEVVLLSAGVGLTPMVAMLETLAANDRSATYLHAAVDGDNLAMEGLSKSLAKRSVIFLETPSDADRAAARYDVEGRITPDWLAANTNTALSDYYICGPKGFMAMAIAGLRAANVDMDRIHFEFFGPAEDLGVA
ncbi:NO-inducible flavohemoprotein (plasmid) [Phaeobacter inhibens]|uniref:NO-inducible flavohemoprotein n=1 Tax=Phaeobacter inhibens TaxID=221822 RepID=UPI0021A856CE|nr:NO-inducible flavohemoprotein [Phaeobacter inhibens]UWS06348.1 NO-inducible flavohemoprotein [Phaeobacter inhibens]